MANSNFYANIGVNAGFTRSRSNSSRGVNAGATIGYGHKIQTTGNGGSISASRSSQNTVETVYVNGTLKM